MDFLNSRVVGATEHSVKLKDGNIIHTKTIIWSGGVAPSSLVSSLSCMHDSKSGRIIVDKYLEIPEYNGVFALGDCAFIIDPNTGNPYPHTAQHPREASRGLHKLLLLLRLMIDFSCSSN